MRAPFLLDSAALSGPGRPGPADYVVAQAAKQSARGTEDAGHGLGHPPSGVARRPAVMTTVTTYDVVLRGGRVIDPESGLDAVRDVAIAGDRVAAVGIGLPPGRQDADVAGQVVTAGFVDLHSHAHDLGSARLQVTDGVTDRAGARGGRHPGGGRVCGRGGGRPAAELRVRRLLGDGPDERAGRRHVRRLDRAAVRQPRGPAVAARCLRGRNRPHPAGCWKPTSPTGRWGSACWSGTRPARRPGEYLRVAALASASGVPTFTHSRDLGRVHPGRARRRCRGDRPRRGRDRCPHALLPRQQHHRCGTPTGCSGWSSALSGRARRSAPRPTPTARA